MIQILIDSDLLLAHIKREDRLKPTAVKILRDIDSGKFRGVYASTASIQEIVFWFYNRRMYKELVEAVNALIHIRNLEWVDSTPDICLTASILMSEYDVSPFDAYHVATAILKDRTIISTKHVYDDIKGVERIDPRKWKEPQ